MHWYVYWCIYTYKHVDYSFRLDCCQHNGKKKCNVCQISTQAGAKSQRRRRPRTKPYSCLSSHDYSSYSPPSNLCCCLRYWLSILFLGAIFLIYSLIFSVSSWIMDLMLTSPQTQTFGFTVLEWLSCLFDTSFYLHLGPVYYTSLLYYYTCLAGWKCLLSRLCSFHSALRTCFILWRYFCCDQLPCSLLNGPFRIPRFPSIAWLPQFSLLCLYFQYWYQDEWLSDVVAVFLGSVNQRVSLILACSWCRLCRASG